MKSVLAQSKRNEAQRILCRLLNVDMSSSSNMIDANQIGTFVDYVISAAMLEVVACIEAAEGIEELKEVSNDK